jgi:enoyl-CoA hydratase/carnithine racemase
LLLGDRIPAREAYAWGMVRQVVTPRQLRRVVTAHARALAARAPIALRYAKEAVSRALDLPLADGVRLEHDLYVLLQTTADRREGIAAFLARRTPRFEGNGERRKTRGDAWRPRSGKSTSAPPATRR